MKLIKLAILYQLLSLVLISTSFASSAAVGDNPPSENSLNSQDAQKQNIINIVVDRDLADRFKYLLKDREPAVLAAWPEFAVQIKAILLQNSSNADKLREINYYIDSLIPLFEDERSAQFFANTFSKDVAYSMDRMDAAINEIYLPMGFDAKTYVSLNPDLQRYIDNNPAVIAAAGGADKWAINHYLNSGKNEGRNFKKAEVSALAPVGLPAGFDPKVYIYLNPDLQDYINRYPAEIAAAGGADKWAINHYLSYGQNEGRNFKKMEAANLPAGFDVKAYVSLNPDLDQYIKDHPADIAAAGGADKWAISHYLSHGKNEGRNFKKADGSASAPVAVNGN